MDMIQRLARYVPEVSFVLLYSFVVNKRGKQVRTPRFNWCRVSACLSNENGHSIDTTTAIATVSSTVNNNNLYLSLNRSSRTRVLY